MGACDVIRVAAEFMVGRWFGSRYGRARALLIAARKHR
jgi:hypothetical protein